MGTLNDELGNLWTEVNSLKDEVTGTGDIAGLGSQITGDVFPETRTIIAVKNTVSSDTFVISDSIRNQLDGTFKLVGSESDAGLDSSVWEQVLNKDNTWEENFDLSTFIDTDESTGSHTSPSGLVEGYYTVDSGEQFQTLVIAKKPNQVFTKATVSVDCDCSVAIQLAQGTTGAFPFTFDLTFGSEKWESFTNNTEGTFTNLSDEGVKLRIQNNGVTFPFTFPSTFAGTVDIENISVKLS